MIGQKPNKELSKQAGELYSKAWSKNLLFTNYILKSEQLEEDVSTRMIILPED